MKPGTIFTDKAEEIADYLMDNHNTENTAIRAAELCSLFHLYKQDLRRLVNYLRSTGLAICSSNNGYWYSESLEDVLATLNHLEGRVVGINRAINGLRECSEAMREKKKE